jgi:hypothetical protein
VEAIPRGCELPEKPFFMKSPLVLEPRHLLSEAVLHDRTQCARSAAPWQPAGRTDAFEDA